MAALFIGYCSEIVGLTILFLPLLFRELSRPRDSVLGGLIILVGLILITSSNSFNSAQSLAVIIEALIFGRLSLEVSQQRWQFLSEQEKKSLKSIDRFKMSIKESFLAFLKLGSIFLELIKVFQHNEKTIKKKWVRPGSPLEETPIKDDAPLSNDQKKLQQTTSPDQISSPKEVNIASEDS